MVEKERLTVANWRIEYRYDFYEIKSWALCG